MNKEKYDKAVKALLDAFDLRDDETIAVNVEPHQVTATVIDTNSPLKDGVVRTTVIGREDTGFKLTLRDAK